jgi:hypothetical protein
MFMRAKTPKTHRIQQFNIALVFFFQDWLAVLGNVLRAFFMAREHTRYY